MSQGEYKDEERQNNEGVLNVGDIQEEENEKLEEEDDRLKIQVWMNVEEKKQIMEMKEEEKRKQFIRELKENHARQQREEKRLRREEFAKGLRDHFDNSDSG